MTLVFAFSESTYWRADALHPLLGEKRANRLFHLIERRTLQSRLVGLDTSW